MQIDDEKISIDNDREITISVGSSARSNIWQPKRLLWSALVDKLRTMSNQCHTTETAADFQQWKKSDKARADKIKDQGGGFVGGTFKKLRRLKADVTGRDIVALDLDDVPAGTQPETLFDRLDTMGIAYAAYSTHSHTAAAPRLRFIFLLKETITGEQYEPIARMIASDTGLMEYCDKSTYDCSRLMYWPSSPIDVTPVFHAHDGQMIGGAAELAKYQDWHQHTQWPRSEQEQHFIEACVKDGMDFSTGKKLQDPRQYKGIRGAFCRAYTIQAAIDKFIPGTYIGEGNRLTYKDSTTTGGAIIYNDGLYLYSNHSHDPLNDDRNRNPRTGNYASYNAFDMVRIHLYGEKDKDAKPGTPVNKLPSYLAMEELANEDDKVAAELQAALESDHALPWDGVIGEEETQQSEEQQNAATQQAADTAQVKPPETEQQKQADNWGKYIAWGSDGMPKSIRRNVVVILEHDSRFKGKLAADDFAHRWLIKGALPWGKGKPIPRVWADDDDKSLRVFMESAYNIKNVTTIDDALTFVFNENSYHAVRDYLNKLPPWDGKPRVSNLFIDYLGAEDTPYNRAVARKFLTGAVGRVIDPGYEFPHMPILIGGQKLGKSALLKGLASKPWYLPGIPAFKGKEAMENIQGYWIVEIEELSAFTKADVEDIKAFVSRQKDSFRLAYGHRTKDFDRQCVLCGTTNKHNVLVDPTGNRRFWPVLCGKQPRTKDVVKDLIYSPNDRNQIWAEALALYKDGEPIDMVTDEEIAGETAAQEEEKAINPWEGMIRRMVDMYFPVNFEEMPVEKQVDYVQGTWGSVPHEPKPEAYSRLQYVCVPLLYIVAIGGKSTDLNNTISRKIGDIMDNMPGWKKIGKHNFPHYGGQRAWVRIE